MIIEHNDKLLVKVPEGAHSFKISNKLNGLYYKWSTETLFLKLPPGSYTILGLASKLSEQEAAGVVDYYEDSEVELLYRDYTSNLCDCKTATESLASLCRSHGLVPGETLVIIKN